MADPLTVVGLFASVVQITDAAIKVFSYLNSIKSASQERAALSLEVATLLPLLSSLQNKIQNSHKSQPVSDALLALARPGGPLKMFGEVISSLQKRIEESVNKSERLKRSLLWQFDKEKVKEELVQIERFKTHLLVVLQSDQIELSHSIKNDTSQLLQTGKLINTINQSFTSFQLSNKESLQHAEFENTLSWLSTLDFSRGSDPEFELLDYELNSTFLLSPSFKAWCVGTKDTFLCSAKPGTGKTILASQVVTHLQSHYPEAAVVQIFLSYTKSSQNHSLDIIASLIKQLLQFNSQMPQQLVELKGRCARSGSRPDRAELEILIRDIIPSIPRLYIVIDGLDEYSSFVDEKSSFLETLFAIRGHANIFITSRHFSSDEIEMVKPNDYNLFSFVANDTDIRALINVKIGSKHKIIGKRPEIQQQIADQICNLASGNFLLAILLATHLQRLPTVKQVKQGLQNLSTYKEIDLDFAYKKTVERISEQEEGYRQLAMDAIGFLTLAKRQITTIELQHFLAVELENKELDIDNIADMDTILVSCAGLLVVSGNEVKFMHFSAKQFFESRRNVQIYHYTISVRCLTYLSFPTFKQRPCQNDREMDDKLEEHPLLLYAASHTLAHVRNSITQRLLGRKEHKAMLEVLLPFLRNHQLCASASQIRYGYAFGYTDSDYYPRNLSGLSIAAIFNLYDAAELLLNEGADGNSKDSYGNTPLIRAARGGSTQMISLLVEHDVDINACDDSSQNALHFAASNGFNETAKELIRFGIDINCRDINGQTALHKAATQAHQTTVALLLSSGIDSSITDDNGLKALDILVTVIGKHAVITSSQTTQQSDVLLTSSLSSQFDGLITKSLDTTQVANIQKVLESLDSNDVPSWTLLHLAVETGDIKLVQYLNESGCDMNRQAQRQWVHLLPVELAIIRGDNQIVQFMIPHIGKDMLSMETILNTAIRCQRNSIIELLLKNHTQAKLCLTTTSNSPVLFYAIQYGGLSIVELLLKHGADVNIRAALNPYTKRRQAYTTQAQMPRLYQDQTSQSPLSIAANECVLNDIGTKNSPDCLKVLRRIINEIVKSNEGLAGLQSSLMREEDRLEISSWKLKSVSGSAMERIVEMLLRDAKYRRSHTPFEGGGRSGYN